MHKFYNPKRTSVNVVLADGSAVLIGGHKTLPVDAISASIRRAAAKGLLIQLPEELLTTVRLEVTKDQPEKAEQPAVEEPVQENFNSEELISVGSEEETPEIVEESLRAINSMAFDEELSSESGGNDSQTDELSNETRASRRKKKRGR